MPDETSTPDLGVRAAAASDGAGALAGKLRQRHHHGDLEQQLGNAIPPGHSGLLALVSDPGEVRGRRSLELADAIVENTIDKVEPDDIRAAATEVPKAGG